jgi:asparagine synthase (glutamine-hydrolysing)
LYHASIPGLGGELHFARQVADHLSMPLHVAEIRAQNFLQNWPLAIYHNDFPSYHPNDVPLYLVCKLARDRGVKVLISGEGADELFGGYSVNLELQRRNHWRHFLQKLPGGFLKMMGAPVEAYLTSGLSPQQFVAFSDMTGSASLGRIRRFVNAELLWQGQGQRLQRITKIQQHIAFLSTDEQASTVYLLERLFGHLGSLLMRNDRMGMMASIETRIPYLSNELLKTWIPMPTKFKVQPGHHLGLKYLLKKIALRYLPSEIINRPKLGFPVPLSAFIHPDARLFKDGFLQQTLGFTTDTARALSQDVNLYYQFASIELWGRLFFFGEAPDQLGNWLLQSCLPVNA